MYDRKSTGNSTFTSKLGLQVFQSCNYFASSDVEPFDPLKQVQCVFGSFLLLQNMSLVCVKKSYIRNPHSIHWFIIMFPRFPLPHHKSWNFASCTSHSGKGQSVKGAPRIWSNHVLSGMRMDARLAGDVHKMIPKPWGK